MVPQFVTGRVWLALMPALLVAMLAPAGAARAGSRIAASTRVSLSASVGWANRYRSTGAWVPVRASVHNDTGQDLVGAIGVPSPVNTNGGDGPAVGTALYSMQVDVPSGETKTVTLYLPGATLPNRLPVQFRSGRQVLASSVLFPIPYDVSDIVVGTLTSDPTSVDWISRATLSRGHFVRAELSSADLVSEPEALSGIDVVLLTNFDSSQFDSDQLATLTQYVDQGGTLLEVAGPDWQRTLRPLPATLIPGRLTGSMRINNLSALSFFAAGEPPRAAATVAVLRPAGSAIGSPGGVPLLVRRAMGVGRLEYLAFDPSQNPFAAWPGAAPLLGRLLTAAAPQAVRRLALPEGFDPLSYRDPGLGRLDPSAAAIALPAGDTLVLPLAGAVLLLLLAAYVLAVGAAGPLLLRRVGNVRVVWLGPPMIAALVTLAVSGAGPTQARAVSVAGVVGALQMSADGATQEHDFVRVQARQAGTPRLLLHDAALAQALPAGAPGTAARNQWSMNEDVPASLSLPAASASGTRTVDLHASPDIRGSIRDTLWVDRSGDIEGTVHNGTSFSINHVGVLAGETWQALPDLHPRSTVRVHVRPHLNVLHNAYDSPLYRAYRHAPARLRTALDLLPDVNALSMLGETLLVGWSKTPLDHLRVEAGPPPSQLHLIVKALDVQLTRGQIDLRTGTFGAYPLDITPVTPHYACCDPSVQGIFLGDGGSADFEFDLPGAPRLRVDRLTLHAFAGGADTSYNAYSDMPARAAAVYDWRTSRWVDLSFKHGQAEIPHANDAISTSGALLVRIRASGRTGDLAVFDPHHDLQLSGALRIG